MAVTTIRAAGLIKTYGAVKALDGLDLEVPEGTVMGMLGPNGAGKTTTVKVLTTLMRPDSGVAEVAGVDVLKNPARVRELIGVSGQYAAVDEYLTGRENLELVGNLYHLGRRRSAQRATELLAQFRLDQAADRPAKTYSGGMRRRLDLAGALVARPQVLFLDEPTTGLDPRSRNEMWRVISELVSGGTTVLLTTQYLEEADRLADSIVVVDHGRVIAAGTADELKAQVGGEVIELVVARPERLADAVSVLGKLGRGSVTADQHTRRASVASDGSRPGAATLVEAIRALDDEGIEVFDVGVRRPTLDDVFLTLTGHGAELGADPDADPDADPEDEEAVR